jgi:hypothetical protein
MRRRENINQAQEVGVDNKKEKIPYKIQKIQLFEQVGLPTPETKFFLRESIEEVASYVRGLYSDLKPLIIRVACSPDRQSMPHFYIDNKEDIENKLSELKSLINSEKCISYIIVQEATPREEASNKISGRLLFGGKKLSPIEEVVELYKGSRSTSVLNNVNTADHNFVSFEKKAGEFLKPKKLPINNELIKEGDLSEAEVEDVMVRLRNFNDKIELARELFSENEKKDEIIFEFWYRNGKVAFTDIDG